MSNETAPAPEYRDPERLDLVSASKMYLVVQCPGQPNLLATLPPEALKQKPEEESEWADSGTRIHTARETGNTLALDKEESETYRQGLAYEEIIVQKWMQDKGLDDCEEGPRELRVWLHDPFKWPDLLGSVKLDVHYYNKERGCVLSIDWKSGFDPNLPPSAHSWQLRFGAVALWREEYGDWMKECRVAHCKPKIKCTPDDYCDYSEIDLKYSWDSIQLHIWQSTQPDAQLRAGPHCNWCPCKAYCVAAGGYSLLPSVIASRIPTMPGQSKPEELVAAMHPADLLKIWENSTVIGKIMDAVKVRLKAMTPEERAALGLELGKGRKLDPIANVPEAIKFLVKEQGFPPADVLDCVSMQKGKLTELVMSVKAIKSKETASEWVDRNLDPWIARCTSEAPLKRIKGM